MRSVGEMFHSAVFNKPLETLSKKGLGETSLFNLHLVIFLYYSYSIREIFCMRLHNKCV